MDDEPYDHMILVMGEDQKRVKNRFHAINSIRKWRNKNVECKKTTTELAVLSVEYEKWADEKAELAGKEYEQKMCREHAEERREAEKTVKHIERQIVAILRRQKTEPKYGSFRLKELRQELIAAEDDLIRL